MSFKIPCGGFKLDEKSFSLDENGVLSIPKPLSYDYMPEGYPSKGIGLVTLMEEQEVTFSNMGPGYGATAPVKIDISEGQTFTIVWDGVEYSCVGHFADGFIYIGNPEAYGLESTGEPFLYANVNSQSMWVSYDTSTSHTIKVMRQQETITPMSADFIPKNFNVVFSASSGVTPTSCNVTYDELRNWIKNGVPVFATYKVKQDDGSVSAVGNIIAFRIDTDKLSFYYGTGATMGGFVYNSDGTFSNIKS